MGRNRALPGSLAYQIQVTLNAKLTIGRSKHKDKLNKDISNYIYSWSTYNCYVKHSNYFALWAKRKYDCKTLSDCRIHIDEWLKLRSASLSAYTVKLDASALAKLYDCSTFDFVATPSRHRSEITRSRGLKRRDVNFSIKKNRHFIEFAKSTGLRRKELQLLTGKNLIFIKNKPFINVTKGTKGGKKRITPVIYNPDLVIAAMKAAGSKKVFDKVPQGADVHGYRSEYALKLYKLHARDINLIPFDKENKGTKRKYQSDVYHCRNDLAGVKYDKKAMLIVSNALGHNRISVIAAHYLR